MVCGLGSEKNCPAAYTNFNSFKSHVYKKHRSLLFPAIQRGIRDSNEAGEGGVAPVERELELDPQNSSEPNSDESESTASEAPDYCYDVPLMKSLQRLTNCEVTAEHVSNAMQCRLHVTKL